MAVAVIIITLSGSVAVAVASPGHLSGLLEWRYGQHTATENGTQVLDAGHFTQKYSLLWDKEGQLMHGRMGKYNVSLGYEWSWIDSRRDNDVKVSIDNPLDKILYRGDVSITPGGLPFNLHLYSYDMQSTRFNYEELGQLFNVPNQGYKGGTITSMNNGTTKISGATLTAGVVNGQYGGKYRDVLTTLPRLLIDYRQAEVHDVRGPFKRDYVDRDLAFISLNQKNNWLHYRVYSHTDNLDSSQNYREKTYLLGNVDHRNQRQWVNLTNWIQVSSDISYGEHVTSPGVNQNLQKRYDLNLFTKASRTKWEGSNFTTFNRTRDENSLDRQIYVPFYFNGELNRDTNWRFQLVGDRLEQDYYAGGRQNTENLFASGKVETFRQSRFIFSPIIEAARKAGTLGHGVAGHVGADFYSNPIYRSPYDFLGQLDLLYFNGTADAGTDVDYAELTAHMRIEKDLNAQFRGGVEQKFIFGNGVYSNTVSDKIFSIANIVSTTQRDSALRSTTGVFLEHHSPSRLRNRVGASVDYLIGGVSEGVQLHFDHALEYDGRSWSVTAKTSYLTGDGLPAVSGVTQQPTKNQLDHVSRISYAPGRTVHANVQFDYNYYDYGNSVTQERYGVRQLAEYAIWNQAGVIRKLAVFGQEFEIENNYATASAVGNDFTAFTLYTNYYPTKATLLGARLRYDIDGTLGTDLITCYLTAGVDFRQFKVSLDYSYGDRTPGDAVLRRTEQRWELNVLKTF
ncbi:hypothetical protein [Geopsychrobacter electrodiphilus]|uniref:hypothetical protein n=1 Tax=Geopsychrobacter electrodiphilus TaxID=225196 RepID=UPI00036C6D72|nr:hypothetical protein [Geopsychrobacter electrodiphilus]